MSKDDKIKVSVGAIASACAAIGSLLLFAEPIVSEELSEKIQAELKPVKDSLEVVMTSSIESYRTSISALRYKREMCGGDFECWTERDAVDLDNAVRNLAAAEAALAGLKERRR